MGGIIMTNMTLVFHHAINIQTGALSQSIKCVCTCHKNVNIYNNMYTIYTTKYVLYTLDYVASAADQTSTETKKSENKKRLEQQVTDTTAAPAQARTSRHEDWRDDRVPLPPCFLTPLHTLTPTLHPPPPPPQRFPCLT